MTQQITSYDEFKSILESNSKVVVEFGSKRWCAPCRSIAPTFHSLAKEYSDKMIFLEIDVDDAESEILTFVGVSGIPRFVAYHKKKNIGDLIGANEQALKQLVQKLNDQS